MNVERIGLVDAPSELAELIRREYGAQLPPSPTRETHRDRDARQERTKWVLEHDVMPEINKARIRAGRPALSVLEEDLIVEMVLSSMFLLPHVLGILEREPLAEDLVVFGSGPTRLDLFNGEVRIYPPLVSSDQALERVISDVAAAHHRPFSFESPFVDVQLTPRIRFHGEGFDVAGRPAIFVRVHRVLGVTIVELFEAGTMSAGLQYFLGTVVPQAGLSVLVTGIQGSGKTTVLRSLLLGYPDDTRLTTIETDFELGMVGLGRQWTHEMQARLPVTTKDRGITPADMIAPALRTGGMMAIGEVRGAEGGPAIRAANVGVGAMATVHGHSAEAGMEQLVDRVAESGTPLEIARRMVYKAFDVVVHCEMSTRNRLRWIGEVVHPLMEGDRPKVHTLYEPSLSAPDGRARASATGLPPQLLHKIRLNFPDFDEDRMRNDLYLPHTRAGTPGASINGHSTAGAPA